jgi:hypothetical protein
LKCSAAQYLNAFDEIVVLIRLPEGHGSIKRFFSSETVSDLAAPQPDQPRFYRTGVFEDLFLKFPELGLDDHTLDRVAKRHISGVGALLVNES